MLDKRLRSICEFIDGWCRQHGVTYSVVCDEGDIQGILLPKKDRQFVNGLLNDLEPLIDNYRIHLETTKVRGGTIFAFSLKAISESALTALITKAGEVIEAMDFNDKIIDAFSRTLAPVSEQEIPSEMAFLVTAVKVVDEGQYKLASQGATRANQTSLQRQRLGSDNTYAGPQPTALKRKKKAGHSTDDPQATTHASQSANNPPTRYEERSKFGKALREALDGMATPSGVQPGDLFSKFAQSLSVLGQNMGTGPLQDQLKRQGINWKKSDDGQAIILYVVNAQTNAPQPIARISAETLEKPSDFETQLINIMDFAKGDAPGTFKQRQAELQAQEKAARAIAQQLGPQDQNDIAQQMAGVAPPQPGQAPMQQGAAPAAPQPPAQQTAPQAATQQAVMPKQNTMEGKLTKILAGMPE